MIGILEKFEHNADIHQIVDFVEASHIRVETSDEETKILATIDGKPRTISESSIRRNLKLKDEAGISSLSDAELFENLTLMGYNISPNQKFTFQKGTPTEPHHRPTPEAPPSPQHELSSSSLLPVITETIPTETPLLGNTPGELGLLKQDKANIIKTSTFTHDSPPRVTSLAVDEGNKYGGGDDPSGEDATIKGRSLETGEEEEVATVSVPPAAKVATVSIPHAGEIPTVSVPTGSGVVPTASPIFTTVTVATPYSKRKDHTITDYSRPSPTIKSNFDDLQNRNSSVTKTGESSSSILSKPVIKFVKAADRPTKIKTNKVETVKKPAIKYAEMYRKTSKSYNVRGNQRN
nr:hypothetical protein [Tanacetum cinerariifolium]